MTSDKIFELITFIIKIASRVYDAALALFSIYYVSILLKRVKGEMLYSRHIRILFSLIEILPILRIVITLKYIKEGYAISTD